MIIPTFIHFFLTRKGRAREDCSSGVSQFVSNSSSDISKAGQIVWRCSTHFPSNIDSSSVVLYLNILCIKVWRGLLFVLSLSSTGRIGNTKGSGPPGGMALSSSSLSLTHTFCFHLSNGLVGKYLLNASHVTVIMRGAFSLSFGLTGTYCCRGNTSLIIWIICCRSLFAPTFTCSRSNPVLFTMGNQSPLWKPVHLFPYPHPPTHTLHA